MTEHGVDATRDPLVEVAVSVQFERLELLSSAYIGVLWSEVFRSDFEKVEEHPPVEIPLEVETPPYANTLKHQVRIIDRPVVPRFFFVNASGNELVQLQQDRFSFSWRRTERYDYRHYGYMRDQFTRNLFKFTRFLEENKLGAILPIHAELHYLNFVFFVDPARAHKNIGYVIRHWTRYDALGGAELEDVAIQVRHRIRSVDEKFLGRVHVQVQPWIQMPGSTPVYRIDLIGRGRPLDPSIEGALGFLDLAHVRLRSAFQDLMSDEVQASWRSERPGDDR